MDAIEPPLLASHFPSHPPPVPIELTVLPEHECPYLPGRVATSRALYVSHMPAEMYHDFMDAGFRRSGKLIYQPVCHGCRACVPIRVPVGRFSPGKSQRRCWNRNQHDVRVTVAEPTPTDEKFALYGRYISQWHERSEAETRKDFESFLYDSPVDTIECEYRLSSDGRLIAIGICDVCDRRSLSSVYFFFDPADAARSLGTFGALYEIDLARRLGLPFYYLGYWVQGCGSMCYKEDYRPNEILGTDGVWRERTRT